MTSIELSAYIESLREEIQRAIELGRGKDVRFFNEKIEMEIEIALETALSAEGEVKLRFLVLDLTAGPEAKSASKKTQTLKLTLIPAYKSEKEGVWISGSGTKMSF